MTTTELVTQTLDLDDPKLLQTLKDTICKDLTDEEFKVALTFCKNTGLNPFLEECWVLKWVSKKTGKPTFKIMVGINGYQKVANSHPAYDNMEHDIIENDKGQITGAWCKVYRKDRSRPSCSKVRFNEYAKGEEFWKEKPSVMILKVAKAVAIREAFAVQLGGSYAPEEVPDMIKEANEANHKNGQKVIEQKPEPATLNALRSPERVLYRLSNPTESQLETLRKHNAVKDSEPGSDLWLAPKPLGKQWEHVRVKNESPEPAEVVA